MLPMRAGSTTPLRTRAICAQYRKTDLGGDAVERFAQPVVLMESPESMALTTPKSAVNFAGEHQHLTSQHDTHLAAGATIATVSGDAASLYTADGGAKVIANLGPISIKAHTDAMEILADQSVTVTSTTDRIDVLAKNKIVLQAGQSQITLEGQNITIACPADSTTKCTTVEGSIENLLWPAEA